MSALQKLRQACRERTEVRIDVLIDAVLELEDTLQKIVPRITQLLEISHRLENRTNDLINVFEKYRNE